MDFFFEFLPLLQQSDQSHHFVCYNIYGGGWGKNIYIQFKKNVDAKNFTQNLWNTLAERIPTNWTILVGDQNMFFATYSSPACIQKRMQNPEKLCLKWNDFQDNLNSAFGVLKIDQDFADVTLACEDGTQIDAHKVILASSSPFFMEMFKKNKHSHPMIYMRGLKAETLREAAIYV